MEEVRRYRAKNRRRYLFIAIGVVLIFILAIYSASVSTMKISFTEAYDLIIKHLMGIDPSNHMQKIKTKIIFDYSMPRTLAAIMVGASLAIGGTMMQSITRNSLTDSYTIGISSAAMLGVTIGIVYGVCIIPCFTGDSASIVNAFIFALIPSIAIIFISSFKKMSPTMMVLIGIGIMYVFNAISTFIKFNASSESLQKIYEWSVGTLSSVTWDAQIPLLAGVLVVAIVGVVLANSINVMSTGDSMARALGVRPILIRIICFVAISVSTGLCVCYTGTIGFVGLIAPHVARLFVGSDNKMLIPTSATLGAIIILGADIIVRIIPGGLPVGVITAFIGSPVFLFILYKQRKNAAF